MGGGDESNDDYPQPALVEASASSELEPAIPFGLGVKKAGVTLASYGKLEFTVFAWGSIFVLVLVLVHRCLYQQGRGGPGDSVTVGW